MAVKLRNDPDRYIRRVKGGKYQARPWDDGERFNLGSSFPTRDAARLAIQEFWWGRRKEQPRFTRKVHTRDGDRYMAEVIWTDMRETRTARLPGHHLTLRAALEALETYLTEAGGRLLRGRFRWVKASETRPAYCKVEATYRVRHARFRERVGHLYHTREAAHAAVAAHLRETCGLFADEMLRSR